MGRIICELERIYGVRQGAANKKGFSVGEQCAVTQSDIADKIGLDERSYANYKKLTTLIPELQEMVDSDQISTSVASRVLARLSTMQRVDDTDT